MLGAPTWESITCKGKTIKRKVAETYSEDEGPIRVPDCAFSLITCNFLFRSVAVEIKGCTVAMAVVRLACSPGSLSRMALPISSGHIEGLQDDEDALDTLDALDAWDAWDAWDALIVEFIISVKPCVGDGSVGDGCVGDGSVGDGKVGITPAVAAAKVP